MRPRGENYTRGRPPRPSVGAGVLLLGPSPMSSPMNSHGAAGTVRGVAVRAWVVAACSWALAGLAGAADLPNIVFMLSDDHSYPYVGCYGDANVRTPNLDRLAAGGMKFRRFFTSAPQCVPSRAAYLSGRSPVAARITRFTSPLPRDVITFPEVLRERAGYYTGVLGRNYHLDGSGGAGGYQGIVEELGLKTFPNRMDVVQTGPDADVPAAVGRFLDGRPKDRPFFLWVNFSDPHHPWNAPAAFRPDPASLTLAPHFPDLPAMREQLADYCAEVNRVDRTAGAVLDALAGQGLDTSTIVIFAGDNGQALPHGKGSLYDPGSNVPFLIRWPGVIAGGGDTTALMSGEDVGPTLLAAVGLEPDPGMTGVSQIAVLEDPAAEVRHEVFVERGPHGRAPVTVDMANSGYDLGRAVRTDRYKLIYNCTPWIPYGPVDSAGGPAWKAIVAAHGAGTLAPGVASTYFRVPRPVYELYDLQADPSELNNLSGTSEVADVERDLRRRLATKMTADFDYLPLPDLMTVEPGGNNRGRGNGNRRVAAE